MTEDGETRPSPPDGVGDVEDVTLVAELTNQNADQELAKAVKGRYKIARIYVRWVRRRNPAASPGEIVALLERHYVTAVSVAGAAVTVGTIGIGLLPGGGAATGGAKAFAIGAAKLAASSKALPAADEQLQFEVTALFALALANIHEMELDTEQQKALVFLLSNGQASQAQISAFATKLAETPDARDVPKRSSAVSFGQAVAAGHSDWSNWASTLARSLPGEGAQSLVRSVQAGKLEDVRGKLGAKQQTAAEMGVGAALGGATRFMFGRTVVSSAREAFPGAPAAFPGYLDLPIQDEAGIEAESNRALMALEDAAKAVGSGFSSGAAAVGSGVATAAETVSRPFRSVDLDGDGVPDEAQALTAVKGAGRAAGSAGSSAVNAFRSVDLDGDGIPDEARALTAVRGTGSALAGAAGAVGGKAASLFRSKKRTQDVDVVVPESAATAPNPEK